MRMRRVQVEEFVMIRRKESMSEKVEIISWLSRSRQIEAMELVYTMCEKFLREIVMRYSQRRVGKRNAIEGKRSI